jgi:hypothetical protein
MVAEERITIVDRRDGEEISVAKGRQAIATEIGQPSGKKNVVLRKDAGFF